jgi:outer membrane biosynthesis protein TonB
MRVGLVASTALHAVVLGWGLITLSAPRALEVADVEAFPVDIVPIDTITQIQAGDRKAPVAERAAPVPTERPHEVPDAQNVGDNKTDQAAPPTPKPSERQVQAAEAPPPSPEPAPKPAPEPQATASVAKPEPVPATERAPEPAPQQEVKPDPVPETAVAETAETEAVQLPQTAPSPMARPQPPQAQTAKAPEQRDAQRPTTQQAQRPQNEEKQFNADEVAALLNKEAPQGGGARRTQEQAALGGRETTTGPKLTQTEMDALRGQIQRCWNVPAGAAEAENLKVSVQFKLDRAGALEGRPEIVSGAGSAGIERAAAESARRAILQCAPYNLPADKYEAWAEVIVHFDPKDMF